MPDKQDSEIDSGQESEPKARWGWLWLIGLAIATVGFGLISRPGFALLGHTCVIGGLSVFSIALVRDWYRRSMLKQPLKVVMCVCLILGLGGCVIDMTLPDDVDFPVTNESLVFLVGDSTNLFMLASVLGWCVFLLGMFIANFRIK